MPITSKDRAELYPYVLDWIKKNAPKQAATHYGSSASSSSSTVAASPTYNISALGVVGDGVNADDKAFQAALDTVGAAGGGYIWAKAPGGAFVLGSRVNVPSNTTLHFLSPVKFKAAGCIAIFGEVAAGPTTNQPRLRSDSAEGTRVLYLEASPTDNYTNFAVGQKIILRGFSDGAGNSTQKQTTFIASISSTNNTLTVTDDLDYTFKAIYPAGDYQANFGIVDRTYLQHVTFGHFTQDYPAGTNTFSVANASGFAPGDFVELSDDTLISDMYPIATYPTSRSHNQFRIEEARVKAVDLSANTITIDRQSYHQFVAANGGGITKLLMTENAHVIGAHVQYLEDSASRNYHTFQIRMGVQCSMEQCSVRGYTDSSGNFWGGRGHGFRFDQALDSTFFQCECLDPKFFESAEGYGFTLYGATHCKILNCYSSNCRHSILFFKGSAGCEVAGHTSVGCRISDYDFHGGNAIHNHVHDCLSIGGPNGTPDSNNKAALKVGNTTHAYGDHYNVFEDNLVIDYGINYPGGTGSMIEIVAQSSHNVFRNNRGINLYRFFYTKSSSNFNDVTQAFNLLEGNTVDGCSTEAMYVGGDTDGHVTIQNLVLRRNTLWNCPRYFIISGCAGLLLIDNAIEAPLNGDANNKYAAAIYNSTNVNILNNSFAGTTRGVKLTNCPAAIVSCNRFLKLVENYVFEDAGGNTGYVFSWNDFIALPGLQYAGGNVSGGTVIQPFDQNGGFIGTITGVPSLSAQNNYTAPQFIAVQDAATTTIDSLLTLIHTASTNQTPAAGMGGSILGKLQQAAGAVGSSVAAMRLRFSWIDAGTTLVRTVLSTYNNGSEQEGMRLDANAAGVRLGFFGAAAVARQTVSAAATDATSTQALVNSLRTALINLGLAQ